MQEESKNKLEEYYIPQQDTEAVNRSRILKATIDSCIETKNKRIIDIGLVIKLKISTDWIFLTINFEVLLKIMVS